MRLIPAFRASTLCAAAAAAGLFGVACPPAFAWEMQGSKAIIARTRDQQAIHIGTVDFEQREGNVVAFKVKMATEVFTDHFLSMKEFKCLESADEIACHVPYPYPQPGTITGHNMAWLEHSFLFLYKKPRDFGAKLWNGVYYRFERTDKGLVGHPQAVDLNHISAPSDKPNVPPYRAALRDDFPAGARWIDTITIE